MLSEKDCSTRLGQAVFADNRTHVYVFITQFYLSQQRNVNSDFMTGIFVYY